MVDWRRKMSKCEQENCPGHLGKFSDCVAEALWNYSMEWQPEQTGDASEFGIWACIMSFPTGQYEPILTGHGEEILAWIPAGQYVVSENWQGFVGFERFNYGSEARARFKAIDDAYSEYLEEDENEDGQ